MAKRPRSDAHVASTPTDTSLAFIPPLPAPAAQQQHVSLPSHRRPAPHLAPPPFPPHLALARDPRTDSCLASAPSLAQEDKAARKAAKAQRKADRKLAQAAAAAASSEPAAATTATATATDAEPPAKKAKKDKKNKDKAAPAVPLVVPATGVRLLPSPRSLLCAPPQHTRSRSLALKQSSSSPPGAIPIPPPLDPTLAGLLRDDPHATASSSASASTTPAAPHTSGAMTAAPTAATATGGPFPFGDIPVDPALLQLRQANAPTPGPAPGPAAAAAPGPSNGKDEDQDQDKPKPAKPARKDKKGKGKAVEPAPTPGGGEGDGAEPPKAKKRRGRPPKAKAAAPAATEVPLTPGARADQFYEELVTKWMNSKQLKEAADSAGATYSTGRFTTTEDAQIDSIVEAFRAERSMSPDDFRAWLVVKRAAADKAAQKADTHDLWERIGRALRTRPLLAIYNHVKARYPAPDAAVAKGERWTEDDDARLADAVNEMGNSWERIGTAVGRSATSCRDRWTKQLGEGKGQNKKGVWTEDEEELLRGLVAQWGAQWKIVSAKMGGSRTATQCRTKWCVACNLSGSTPRK